MKEKHLLRAGAIASRDALPFEARENLSAYMLEHIRAFEGYRQAGVVMAYAAIGSEANVWPIIRDALAQGKRVALPVCVDKRHMRAVCYDGRLRIGRMGILEPMGEVVVPKDIDLLLIPGLLFTREGVRLGYGAGYYDAFLTDTRALRIGVGYGAQRVDELPSQPHDVRMQALLSEQGLFACEKPRR